MNEIDHIVSLEGDGVLCSMAGRTWGVQYNINVSEEVLIHHTTTGQSVTPSLQTIEGAVIGLEAVDLFQLVGKPVTLRLEDGQTWECYLKNTDGDLSIEVAFMEDAPLTHPD